MDAAGSEGSDPTDKRIRKTPFQLNILEKTYAGNAYPSEKVRAKLSVQLDLTDRQLQKWFCKRRLKDRKKPNKIGHNMGKTKEHASSNTNNCPTKKKQKVLAEAVDIITEQKEIDSGDSRKEMNVNDDDSLEWAQALEPVRKLPTNVGSRIKRCIYESLIRNPPKWAREILEHSISEKVYKGNAAGPTKRAVISVLEKVRVGIPQAKPTEEKENEKSGLRTSYEEEIGYNTGRTKERAWRNTNTHTPKKKLKQTQKVMSKTKKRAWRNTNNQISKKKQKPIRKLPDDDNDDGDVEHLDPKQENNKLVENVSPMLDSLLDDDGDGELLVPKQEQCDLAENVSPMLDSQEKLSFCESDLVCVQGYKVKRSNATILEAVFKKHGDIAADCVFKTSSTRTHFLEVVCEIVRQIQTNDMIEMAEDIERLVSDAEAANINVSWIRARFEACHKRTETSKRCSLLMEMKSNTSLVRAAAQMDLKERCAELMSAQERFKNAERCVRVLHLVEKNLNENMLESKSKLDSWVEYPIV